MFKKTMLFITVMRILTSPLKSMQQEGECSKKRNRPAVFEANSDPNAPDYKKFKMSPLAVKIKPTITIKGYQKNNDEYAIISTKINMLSAYSKYIKTLLTSNFSESINKTMIMPFSCPKEDVENFLKLIKKWHHLNSSIKTKTNNIFSEFFEENLDENNIVSIIKFANDFIVTEWYPYLALSLVNIASLDDIKTFFKTIELNNELLIEILKNLTNRYNEIAIGNLTDLTKKTFSLIEVNMIKPLKLRQGTFEQNGQLIKLIPSTIYCTLNSIDNLDIILKNNDLDINAITRLDLSKNQIQNIEPINSLRNIQWLNLSKNQIQNIDVLKTLTNIQELGLSNNKIQNIDILKTLTNIHRLSLSNNKIQNIYVLKTLTKIEDLLLSNNQIENIDVLKTLTNIQILDLSNNKIKFINTLETLTNIQTLNLSNNQIQYIDALKKLTKIHRLNLSNNQIQDIGALEALTKIQWLYLSKNQIQNIDALKNNLVLVGLFLSNNKIKSINILNKLVTLKELEINFNNINDFSVISKQNRTLTNLSIIGNPLDFINHEQLYSLLPDTLKDGDGTLGISGDNYEISSLLEKMPKLKTVYLTKENFDFIKQNKPEVLKNRHQIGIFYIKKDQQVTIPDEFTFESEDTNSVIFKRPGNKKITQTDDPVCIIYTHMK